MRRIAVPIDRPVETVCTISEVQHLLEPGGEFMLLPESDLLLDGKRTQAELDREDDTRAAEDLQSVAVALQDQGIAVRVLENIDTKSKDFGSMVSRWGIDMICCPTFDPHSGRRLSWRSTLRRALTHSPVPILVCRPSENRVTSRVRSPRLLVPLDGSEFAETALPLAEQLGNEWNATLWLTQVVPVQTNEYNAEVAGSMKYLEGVARQLNCAVRINLVVGRSVTTMLVRTVKDWSITEVVMASHGRTASPNAIVGSVAEALIQHLDCRIVILPPAAAESIARTRRPIDNVRAAPLPQSAIRCDLHLAGNRI